MEIKAEWRRLRELEWRELDVKDAGGWPWSLRLACCLSLLGLVLAGMRWHLVSPAIEALERARAEEVRLLRDYRLRAVRAAGLDEMRDQVAALESRLAGWRELFLGGAEVPMLIDGIGALAADSQLAIDAIRLGEPVSREHYVERPFDIQVRGEYHRIVAFLAGVAELPRLVTLHDLILSPEDGDGLRLRLAVRAHAYGEPVSEAWAP